MSLLKMTLPASRNLIDTLLSAALALPLVLVALLMAAALSAVQAKAQGDITCSGDNLLEVMKAQDPAQFAALQAQAEEIVFGDANLFRIEQEGVAPSYLFGTMHLTDPRVRSMDATSRAAMNEADTIVIETTELLDETRAQLALMSKPELTMFTGDARLSDWLDDDEKALVEEGLSARGMRLALIDRMKPWIVNGLLSIPACEMDRKHTGVEILDITIARHAQEEGKTLVGLETIIEQMSAVASLPMEDHVDGLVESLRLGSMLDDVIETMIAIYLEDRPGMIWPFLRTVQPDGGNPSGYAHFQEVMIDQRNATMIERATPLLKQGGAFIAVGALHLPGEKGLAKMAQDAGFTVTPIRN